LFSRPTPTPAYQGGLSFCANAGEASPSDTTTSKGAIAEDFMARDYNRRVSCHNAHVSSGAPESDHQADLALAAACAAGDEAAWERFVREFRPGLYRSADAIDPTGGARDLADALFAELFGMRERDGVRQSLFKYYQGRSSLATWLRAVLAQRHVDRIRATRRLVPLPDDDAPPQGRAVRVTPSSAPDPDESGCRSAVRLTLADAISRLDARDRLRLGCYYVQDLTLSAIGKMFGEHEATASRHLTRIRRELRATVEVLMRETHGFAAPALADCLRTVMNDAGDLDLGAMLARTPARIVQNERDPQ
jgi:RNA polymerase sigma factor (sigma-70 family)